MEQNISDIVEETEALSTEHEYFVQILKETPENRQESKEFYIGADSVHQAKLYTEEKYPSSQYTILGIVPVL